MRLRFWKRPKYSTSARQTNTVFEWRFLGHVEPPPIDPQAERSLIYYLGPNHYPAGMYLPDGYNIEWRPGDDPGWIILRARDSKTEQILTMWGVLSNELDEDGEPKYPGAVRIWRSDS